jgi:hypothetical protein
LRIYILRVTFLVVFGHSLDYLLGVVHAATDVDVVNKKVRWYGSDKKDLSEKFVKDFAINELKVAEVDICGRIADILSVGADGTRMIPLKKHSILL